jgi:PAS domain S-box-containing protein
MTEKSGNTITHKTKTRDLRDLRNQEKLPASDRTLKLFVEYAPAAIAMFDREMKYLAVSKRFIRDYHLKNKDIVGHSHYEIFPEISDSWKAIHQRCLKGAVEKADKDPFLRMDGNIDWIRWEIHPWFEKSGKIGGIVIFSEVITERIQAEEELRKSENRFRITLENMLEGCQIMDFNWRYIFLNHSAEIHNRIPREKMLGKTYTEVWPGIEKTHVYAEIRKCLEERTSIHMENEFTYPDGLVGWFELSIQPVPEGVFILSIDITNRKRAEQKLMEANEELELRVAERTKQFEAANKELEAFSYSVSHDLRAPLRAMSGFAKILRDTYSSSLNEEGIKMLEIITGNAKKMGNLIDDLLAFSRLGKQETYFTLVNMHDLAESVYNDLATEKEKAGITFILHDIPLAFGDISMIKQVWVNLIGNAMKFSALKKERIIEIDGRGNGPENIYSVKDNGAGFNMKYANKMFGVFQRLHSVNQFEGTGVGLAIVQRIIVRLNGRIWAEGVENEGATFHFTLPAKLNS